MNLDNLPPELAQAIEQTTYDANAKCVFEFFSGSLMWSDERCEIIDFSEQPPHFYKHLCIYRTSLIKGQEMEHLRTLWEQTEKLFPHWPLFRPQRRDPSLIDLVRQGEKDRMEDIGE